MEVITSFGYWLRRRRKALDLTQEELARRVGCAVATVKKIETDLRRPSRQLAERLATLLEIAPEDRAGFLKAARAELQVSRLPPLLRPGVDPLLHPHSHDLHNLPVQTTVLIGRDQTVAEVCALLRQPAIRVVTLTGPGGVGKTRLAIQVAAALLDDNKDGVFLVMLDTISDPDMVAPTIAQTLGVREIGVQSPCERLKGFLRNKRLLLLLDNFEQVASAAPLVSELLAVAPGLKVLVTSRVTIRISGEHEIVVPPLAIPDLQNLPDLTVLAQYPTVALFIACSQATKPDFRLTPDNAQAIAQLCACLDGLPLAIELAAARSKILSPRAMLARLNGCLDLLNQGGRDRPTRQQTLRGTIDWSYALLKPLERTLFARLAVFVGGCTLVAAQMVLDPFNSADEPLKNVLISKPAAVLTAQLRILDQLTSLVDQSMVRQINGVDGEARFTMLALIREYAWEHLQAYGEADAVRQRHAKYYLELAETAEPELTGPQQGLWLARLEEEHDNLRASLTWALEQGDLETAVRLSGALGKFWHARGYIYEGRQWLTAVLTENTVRSTVLRGQPLARAFSYAGVLAADQSEYAQAITLYQAGLEHWRLLGASSDLANTIISLGILATIQGAYAWAIPLYQESLALYQKLGDRRGMANALVNLGVLALYQGTYASANRFFNESLALHCQIEDKRGIAFALSGLAGVALCQDHARRAYTLFEQSLVLGRALGDKRSIALFLNSLGLTALSLGDTGQAHAFFVESLMLRQKLGDKEGIIWNLEGLAISGAMQSKMTWGLRLFEVTKALRAAIGAVLPPAVRSLYERLLATTGIQLASVGCPTEDEMTLEQVIAYVLAEHGDTVFR